MGRAGHWRFLKDSIIAKCTGTASSGHVRHQNGSWVKGTPPADEKWEYFSETTSGSAGDVTKICYTCEFGAVPKWPKGEVCKTSIRGFESHPRLHFFAFVLIELGLPLLNLYLFCTLDYQGIVRPSVAHVGF